MYHAFHIQIFAVQFTASLNTMYTTQEYSIIETTRLPQHFVSSFSCKKQFPILRLCVCKHHNYIHHAQL